MLNGLSTLSERGLQAYVTSRVQSDDQVVANERRGRKERREVR